MNPESALELLSGGGAIGVLAVVVVALAVDRVRLEKRKDVIQDARLKEAQESARIQAETTHKLNDALKEVTRAIEIVQGFGGGGV